MGSQLLERPWIFAKSLNLHDWLWSHQTGSGRNGSIGRKWALSASLRYGTLYFLVAAQRPVQILQNLQALSFFNDLSRTLHFVLRSTCKSAQHFFNFYTVDLK